MSQPDPPKITISDARADEPLNQDSPVDDEHRASRPVVHATDGIVPASEPGFATGASSSSPTDA